MSAMPKPSEQTKSLFRDVIPADDRVQTRPMFGQLAGFVNGHMFGGIFGDSIFVRPSDADRAALLKEGGRDFEPMPGRPMKGYVVLADAWLRDTQRLQQWLTRALETTAAFPPKAAKPAKAAKATKTTKTTKTAPKAARAARA